MQIDIHKHKVVGQSKIESLSKRSNEFVIRINDSND